MNTQKILRIVLAVILIKVTVAATGWALLHLDSCLPPPATVLAVLALVFLFIAGATWLGRLAPGRHRTGNSGAVFALLLTVSGVLLLCFNAGLLPVAWRPFFFSGAMLLYVLGAVAVCRAHLLGGGAAMLAGAFFLIPKTALIYPGEPLCEQFCETYWPVLLILPGVIIFCHAMFHRHWHPDRRMYHRHRPHWKDHAWANWWQQHNRCTGASESGDGRIDYQSVFGGIEQVILDPVFHGGTLEAILGGIELDLRHTSLPDGETYLYATTVFGGIQITVPPEWNIEIIPAKTIAGGVNDTRTVHTPPTCPDRKLIIVAECSFGGVVIK
jgi:hypothetical protein